MFKFISFYFFPPLFTPTEYIGSRVTRPLNMCFKTTWLVYMHMMITIMMEAF
jgi:hypothetical protein